MPNFHLINICVFYRYYNFFSYYTDYSCHDISFPFRTILGGRKIAITIVRNNNTGVFFFLSLHKVLHPNLERDNRVFTTL
ncbi:BAP_1a_G0036880.mRNA.1.CDS.1 [Saccharomyces cerevisiae]|nr:BAP_1a_G0036880.mRNA.1.CDS.1 [Saccharomyces cerevisiae]CAI7236875.1 BAP_1a_G0036880.mRNA.1.CDS.1 [Saccharomyces cerevisiae]